MIDFPESKKIILFDGVCNLCDSSVQYIIKHDKKDIFRFVALQSELGQEIIKYIGIQDSNIDSIVFYEPKLAYYYKSEAALQIAKNLGGFFYFATVLNIFPTGFLNIIYDFIAKNRYKWFGEKQNCMIPNKEIKSKFLG